MVGASRPGVVGAHAVVEELADVEGLGCLLVEVEVVDRVGVVIRARAAPRCGSCSVAPPALELEPEMRLTKLL